MKSGSLAWLGRYSSSDALVTRALHRFKYIALPCTCTVLRLFRVSYHLKECHCNVLVIRVQPGRIGIQITCTFSQMESAKFGELVVSNAAELEKKKSAIRASGPAKLQVIADFDMTLTKCWVDGKRGQSSHALLKQGNTEYDLKRQQLYDYYRPLEVCPTIAIDEKTKLMEEWWEKTHALLVEGGLNYAAIRDSVSNSEIGFRDGVTQLFEILEKLGVPVLIFSAGLADIIEEVMRQKLHRNFKNVKVVSNRMVFDVHGNLVGFKGKTIHVLNKNEHALEMAAPVHEKLGNINGLESDDNSASVVKDRKNVLLLGDHIGDLGMSDGLDHENRISVAFLNENVEKSMDIYKEAYDIVLPNDAPMWEVVNLIKELCSQARCSNVVKIQNYN